MENTSNILKKTSVYVQDMLRDKLPLDLRYHCPSHSEDVAQNCRMLAIAMGVPEEEIELVELAGWFHDTGYVDTTAGHEERGIQLMESFLSQSGYPAERRALIAGCIRATKMPQSPTSLLEKIVCDADLLNFGTPAFFKQNDLIRLELESLAGKKFSDEEWLLRSESLLKKHHFHTEHAEHIYGPEREHNLETIQAMLEKKADYRAPVHDTGAKQSA
ncbi:MAG: HD domain-containing protein [Ignavibacteriales bacterium]|nr:HD domain-containing protein [Ignavibacteriales bacterium]